MTNRKAFWLAASAALPLMAVPAQAQQAPSSPEVVAGTTGNDTGEIIVTARKRSESLQAVPLSITAFTAADIKSARIESLADVAKLTPGLNYTPLFGAQNQLPIIRGAAQTIGELNVGVFLDGVYLTGKAAVDLELNDLERVEVIKGPQSALYGRNTFAGAINYITKRPSDHLTGTIEGTGGSDGYYKGIASISGPLSDTVRFRAGGYYKHFDGYYRSGIDGGKVDFEKSYGGTGTIEWKPSAAFTATGRVTYSKDENGQPPSSVITNNSYPGIPAGSTFPGFPAAQIPVITRNLLYIGNLPEIPKNGVLVNTGCVPGLPGGCYGDRERNLRASLTLDYDFGGVALTSISAYAYRKAEYTYDGDNTVCSIAGGCPNFGFPFAAKNPFGKSDYALSSNTGYFRDISQEVRLASTGVHTIDWLIGGYYYNDHNSGIDRGISLGSALAITDYNAGAAAYTYPQSFLTTEAYSAFGSLTLHATDKLSLTGEVRYEHENKTFVQHNTNPVGANVFDLARSFHFWTPRLIAKYQFDSTDQIYASYSRGAKTGGFNTGLNVTADQRNYNPEYANNYEVGVKTEWLDRTLRFNVAGYYIDWTDQQAACQNPVSSGGSSTNRTYICNVAASTIYGAEADMLIRPSDWFSVSASYTFTHARYTAFVDASLAQVLALAGLPAIDFNGKHLPYVPDHKVVVSPRANFPLGNKVAAELRADLSMQSKTYLRADNLQNFDSKVTVDLRAGLTFDRLSLQLFADNVFNDATPVAGVRFFDSGNYSLSSPYVTGANRRRIGATLGYRF